MLEGEKSKEEEEKERIRLQEPFRLFRMKLQEEKKLSI
jgi:hypothetical protein